MPSDQTRRERIDRGIRARTDDVFAVSSWRNILYLTLPRAVAIIALLSFPLLRIFVGVYWQNVLLVTLAVSLTALSWNLLSSVGLVSLGQALFYGAGAYTTGYISQHWGLSPFLTIPLGTVGGAAICTLLLYPVLRLRGIYFALVTFAMPLLFIRVIDATKILGGAEGMSGLPALPSGALELYALIAVTLGVAYGLQRLMDSDYGLVLQAIKDNDRSVIASGINIQWMKAQAVFMAALPATFAGTFVTHHYQFAGISTLGLENSILPLTAVIVGGAGPSAGAMVGAFLLVPLSEALRAFGTLRVVVYSLVLVVFVVGLPEGIFHFAKRKYQQFERPVDLE